MYTVCKCLKWLTMPAALAPRMLWWYECCSFECNNPIKLSANCISHLLATEYWRGSSTAAERLNKITRKLANTLSLKLISSNSAFSSWVVMKILSWEKIMKWGGGAGGGTASAFWNIRIVTSFNMTWNRGRIELLRSPVNADVLWACQRQSSAVYQVTCYWQHSVDCWLNGKVFSWATCHELMGQKNTKLLHSEEKKGTTGQMYLKQFQLFYYILLL